MRLSEGRGNKRSDQMDIPFSEPTSKRKELAKIANTSEGSIQRTKYILENGTEEQIERARKRLFKGIIPDSPRSYHIRPQSG